MSNVLAMRDKMEQVWLKHNPQVAELLDTCVRGSDRDMEEGEGVATVATMTFDAMFWTRPFGESYERWQFETALKCILDFLKEDTEDVYAEVFTAHAETIYQTMRRYMGEREEEVLGLFISFWKALPEYLKGYDEQKPFRNWLLAAAVRHASAA